MSAFAKVTFAAVCASASATDTSIEAGNSWNWNQMSESREFSSDWKTFQHFDTNYMMGLIGTNGHDDLAVHNSRPLPKIGLSSMEKVVSLTSRSTRASIRHQLVDLLKKQVAIESLYSTKKEKLYISASAVYGFIGKLLHTACATALGNDGLWKEQMQCFSAYRQLLEIYSMWNAVRDINFALEHGMTVEPESMAICQVPDLQEKLVAEDISSQKLQNQYLIAAVQRQCFDTLQVKIDGALQYFSHTLVSMDSDLDRGASCLFRVITVLTCLSSGNQENLLNLAIKEEHKQHQVFSFARYASVALRDAEEQANLETHSDEDEETQTPSLDNPAAASFMQMDGQVRRDARKINK